MPDLSREERSGRGWLYDRGLFVSDLPSAEWVNAVDELLADAERLARGVASACWVFNNLHMVEHKPQKFIAFARAAAEDCREALAQHERERA